VHRLRILLLACACFFSVAALASPTMPENGAEYAMLATPTLVVDGR
jgi:hypothetical protein